MGKVFLQILYIPPRATVRGHVKVRTHEKYFFRDRKLMNFSKTNFTICLYFHVDLLLLSREPRLAKPAFSAICNCMDQTNRPDDYHTASLNVNNYFWNEHQKRVLIHIYGWKHNLSNAIHGFWNQMTQFIIYFMKIFSFLKNEKKNSPLNWLSSWPFSKFMILHCQYTQY